MPPTLATKQAAIKLQVSPNTLRNWSDQYADFLSEAARPGHLPERQFADKDMTVLTYIKQLRAEGMKEDSIKTRLSETKFNDTEILQAGTSALQVDVAIASVDASEGQGLASSNTLAYSVISAIDSLQRRVDGLEIQQQTPAPIVAPEYLVALNRLVEALEQSRQAPDELPAFLAVVNQHDKRLAILETPSLVVEPAPVAKQRDGITMFGVGFVAALLFMVAIIGLAVLYGGFK